ncbi:MAG TPA: carboxypeptidase-like regulatory domain-containing protein [Pirellulales bacterium]|nr:carboxypeptidase-like regulatory domain-containing protein [Pirellulales bacterium]
MRRLFFLGLGLVLASLTRSPRSTVAATIEGRVVDSAGKPLAGAEVRIWQKLRAPDGRFADRPVEFDGGDVLLTDADGRFVSPDVLAGEAFARIVIEADGMLAGRSGWIEIGNDAAVAAPDILLRRLRTVTGDVNDRRGQPVARVTAFNSGDGHRRVEAKTGRTGKFLLEGVPEGPVFLFAEKSGYRFTGQRLEVGRSIAGFTLALVDEEVEPLATLPPLVSPDDEKALARQVLDPWLREARSGTEMQKMFALASLSHIDPLEAFEAIDAIGVQSPKYRTASRNEFLNIAITREVSISTDKLQELIEAGDQPFAMAYQYVLATRHLGNGDRQQQRAWLDAALVHARRIDGPAQRAQLLAVIAGSLFSVGDRDRGTAVLAEAETSAESIPHLAAATNAIGELALATVHQDPQRAFRWWEKVQNGPAYERRDGELASRLLRQRPELAEKIWDFAMTHHGAADARAPPRVSSFLPDICYGLTKVDIARAERLVVATEQAALRIRGQGAIALALAECDPAGARRRLELLIRDEFSRLATDESRWFRSWSAPATAAWLLPIAERVAPDLCAEILW